MQYVVDTHALVWFLEGNRRLGANARQVLEDPASKLILPAIALAEAMWVVEKGRSSIPSVAALLATIQADPRIEVIALDVATIIRTDALQVIKEMHDRQVVATTLQLQDQGGSIPLISWDQNITDSGLVKVIW